MPEKQSPLITPLYKSYGKLLAICINVSLSAFWVGYSLVYMGSIGKEDFKPAILEDYNFLSWKLENDEFYKSIIQGVLPIGAIFGALLSSQLIRRLSRRMGFLATNLLAFLSILLMVYIYNPYTFLLARLLQGICTGIFSAIVPLYINEIVTPDCTNLGSLNQIFIGFAQFFCFLLAFILSKVLDKNSESTFWKIIAEFPLLIILIQTFILLFVFPYETPKYLYEKGERQKAGELISLLYHQDHTEEALARYMTGQSVTEEESQIAIKPSLVGVQNPLQRFVNSKAAIFFAIHLALLQQMSGVNAIMVYGKNTLQSAIGTDNVNAIGAATLGLSGGPFLAAIVTIKLMNLKGRKFLIQIGTLVCCICLGALGISFILKGDSNFDDSIIETIIIIIGMCIFMTVFGLTLGPIVWLYIPEIVEPNVIPYSTMTNLFGAALCILTFPLIPKDFQGYPFLFFFAWCLLSLFINQRLMVQTRNKSREKVFEQYRTKKLC